MNHYQILHHIKDRDGKEITVAAVYEENKLIAMYLCGGVIYATENEKYMAMTKPITVLKWKKIDAKAEGR